MALQQFKNLSSWREHSISIQAKSVGELDFKDTFPNMFVVQNPNDCIVYIGISKTPTENSYEFRIGNNSNDCFGRPTGTNKVLFYNSSEKEIFLKVFSVYDSFNLLVLKNMSALIEQATVITDGIVKGFSDTTSLPSGTNTIGKIIPYGEEWKELLANISGINSKTMDCEILEEILLDTKNYNDIISNFVTSYSSKISNEKFYSVNDYIENNGTVSDNVLINFYTLNSTEGVSFNNSEYHYYLKINFLQIIKNSDSDLTLQIGNPSRPTSSNRVLTTFNTDEIIMNDVCFKIIPNKSSAIFLRGLNGIANCDFEVIAVKKVL